MKELALLPRLCLFDNYCTRQAAGLGRRVSSAILSMPVNEREISFLLLLLMPLDSSSFFFHLFFGAGGCRV